MNFKFWLFLKASEIVAEVSFVKSLYRDTRTCDFARKYLISSGIAQQKVVTLYYWIKFVGKNVMVLITTTFLVAVKTFLIIRTNCCE